MTGAKGRAGEDASYFVRHAAALTSLLREKGVVTEEDLRAAGRRLEAEFGSVGARAVARAWKDPGFKKRLLEDASAALEEAFGVRTKAVRFAALEDTPQLHHLVICTLCSCYPLDVLGRPPAWYKSLTYRSRAASDPRGVLREFGLDLPPTVEVRVVDSSADFRYFVLPLPPPGIEGMGEEELAGLITRDSMVGTGLPLRPEGA